MSALRCSAGRIDGRSKVSHAARDEGVDTTVCNYGYFNDVDQVAAKSAFEDTEGDVKGHMPTLFAKDRRPGGAFALACPQKKVHELVVARFAAYILDLG